MNRLKELRKEKNLTQSQFGELWGASQNTVSNWENGNREMSQDLLVRISAYFGVTIGYLLGLEDEQTKKIEENKSDRMKRFINAVQDMDDHEIELAQMFIDQIKKNRE